MILEKKVILRTMLEEVKIQIEELKEEINNVWGRL